MEDPLETMTPALLCKLASIVVHADELTSPSGHEFDAGALRALIGDGEVAEFIKTMSDMGLAPVKRS